MFNKNVSQAGNLPMKSVRESLREVPKSLDMPYNVEGDDDSRRFCGFFAKRLENCQELSPEGFCNNLEQAIFIYLQGTQEKKRFSGLRLDVVHVLPEVVKLGASGKDAGMYRQFVLDVAELYGKQELNIDPEELFVLYKQVLLSR